MFEVLAFVIGFLIGINLKDKKLWELCKAQQERGDYWYDKYMIMIKDDWESLSKD